MIILHLLHIALFALFGLPMVYLAFLTCAALNRRRGGSSEEPAAAAQAAKVRRFAVVVPAHNEEVAIEKTIGSLHVLDYPPAFYDIIVVADNCTDHTAELARRLGARVMERTDARLRGKGYALRWCFDRILRAEPGEEGYDAVVVIDADTVVSGNYLRALNVALEAGADLMQTSDLAEPHRESWTAQALRLSFVLYNYVRPLGRTALGFSAGLRGNGMCFTRRALLAVPWHAYSKAEDLEYGLVMLLAGYRTHFVPDALALATMPHQAANAESQRARWEGGRLAVMRRYLLRLLKASVRGRSLAALDACIDLATPAFVNMMAVSLTCFAFWVIVWAWGMQGGGHAALWAWIWAGALIGGAVHVTGGLVAAGDPTLWGTLAAIPRYVTWKAALYLKLARKKPSGEWVRTTREAAEREAGVRK